MGIDFKNDNTEFLVKCILQLKTEKESLEKDKDDKSTQRLNDINSKLETLTKRDEELTAN